jgi:hypothetical protein
MYTVIKVHEFCLQEFNHDDIDYLLDYIDGNLYSFPCNISRFDSSIRINDNTGNELYIIGLTKLEMRYFTLKYTKQENI